MKFELWYWTVSHCPKYLQSGFLIGGSQKRPTTDCPRAECTGTSKLSGCCNPVIQKICLFPEEQLEGQRDAPPDCWQGCRTPCPIVARKFWGAAWAQRCGYVKRGKLINACCKPLVASTTRSVSWSTSVCCHAQYHSCVPLTCMRAGESDSRQV